MGYSTSRKTLEAIAPLLQPLIESKPQIWSAPSEAHKLAYKLREGLYIAKLYASEYPELAAAAENFSIEVVDLDTVQAVQRKGFKTEAVMLVESKGGTQPTAVTMHGAAVAGKKHEMVGPSTAAAIIGFWIENQQGAPSAAPFRFPQSQLNMTEMVKLYEWTRRQHLIIMLGVDGITLQHRSKSNEDLAWTPADGID